MRYASLTKARGGPHLARTIAELPKGTRITDYISLGVLSKTFPLRQVKAVLAEILQERVVSSRWCRNPRGVKRKMSNFPLRPRGACLNVRIEISGYIKIVK